MCMSVVEHELKRHRQLLDDLGKKKKNCIQTYLLKMGLLLTCTHMCIFLDYCI